MPIHCATEHRLGDEEGIQGEARHRLVGGMDVRITNVSVVQGFCCQGRQDAPFVGILWRFGTRQAAIA
jgi:hypothetical protein